MKTFIRSLSVVVLFLSLIWGVGRAQQSVSVVGPVKVISGSTFTITGMPAISVSSGTTPVSQATSPWVTSGTITANQGGTWTTNIGTMPSSYVTATITQLPTVTVGAMPMTYVTGTISSISSMVTVTCTNCGGTAASGPTVISSGTVTLGVGYSTIGAVISGNAFTITSMPPISTAATTVDYGIYNRLADGSQILGTNYLTIGAVISGSAFTITSMPPVSVGATTVDYGVYNNQINGNQLVRSAPTFTITGMPTTFVTATITSLPNVTIGSIPMTYVTATVTQMPQTTVVSAGGFTVTSLPDVTIGSALPSGANTIGAVYSASGFTITSMPPVSVGATTVDYGVYNNQINGLQTVRSGPSYTILGFGVPWSGVTPSTGGLNVLAAMHSVATNTPIGSVSLGNSTGKTSIWKAGTLASTATTANQICTGATYTATAGKVFYLQQLDLSARLTSATTTTFWKFGSVNITSPTLATTIKTIYLGGFGASFSQDSLVWSEPMPLAPTNGLTIYITPASAHAFTWQCNFSGYEK